jgi:hypothetical protein
MIIAEEFDIESPGSQNQAIGIENPGRSDDQPKMEGWY